jgi:3-hydroxyacyl-[acyl-carrier-protein] dehydratase
MMENKEIQSILPHRYPFLLVDRIIELVPGKRGVGIKNFTGDEWCLNGRQMYPPVLLLESLAQVGGIVLGSKAREENPASRFFGLFAGVSDFQFPRSPVVGEPVTLRVELSQSLASIYRFQCEVQAGGEKIAAGQILLSFSRST